MTPTRIRQGDGTPLLLEHSNRSILALSATFGLRAMSDSPEVGIWIAKTADRECSKLGRQSSILAQPIGSRDDINLAQKVSMIKLPNFTGQAPSQRPASIRDHRLNPNP